MFVGNCVKDKVCISYSIHFNRQAFKMQIEVENQFQKFGMYMHYKKQLIPFYPVPL